MTKARRWEHACFLGMARRPVWLVPGEEGREASSWGALWATARTLASILCWEACFDRITTAMVLRRDFREIRQNLGN